MKKIVIVIIIIYSLLFNYYVVDANDDTTIVYFYSSTCGSCHKLTSYFDNLQDKYDKLEVKKYNITNLKYKNLQQKYNEAYNVTKDDEGIVPVVFIKDKYFTGEQNIKNNIEKLIENDNEITTLELTTNSVNFEKEIYEFLNFRTLSVFFAGLVNGLNPCSIATLLFFLSLMMVKKINILKIGIAFIIGKFISYLLLGTIFFNILAVLNISWINTLLKVIMLLVVSLLIFLNIQDFFAAKNHKYNKIKVQLPTKIRKFTNNIIKKMTSVKSIKFVTFISFLLGMIVCLGEFLCTGQIYLATIVTVLQTSDTLSLKAMKYLLVYDFAFIIPLIILTLIIYKGKEVFDVSEVVREKLHIIKLINAGLFLIFGIIVLMFY